MAGCDQWALLKILEVVLCVTCLLFKWWSDEEASRLFFYLEKHSREWPLLNNITWNQPGSWFADVTYGGYVIITIGLLVAHIFGELRHSKKTETFLLGIGALLFFGVGCMVITAFDNVPESLVDNAIILGVLSIVTGFIFIIDIGCFKRRQRSDKVDRQDKQFRMKRDTTADGVKSKKEVTVITEKSSSSKQNGVKNTGENGNSTQKENVISELRSSIKKKKDKQTDNEVQPRVDNEKPQTKENVQYGRKNLENRGFSQNTSKPKQSVDENDNAYDYDQQSIRNYDEEKPMTYPDSDDSADSGVYYLHYERKSRGSQTSRKHFQKTVSERMLKDAGTSTESPKPVRVNNLNYRTQSPTVSTTNPQKSDSPTSEETYELHAPASSSYLVTNGKKFQPIITPSRIERLAQNTHTLNKETRSVPPSPQDPGYVLHTASKWPNTSPLAPQPYKKWKENEKVMRSVQSTV